VEAGTRVEASEIKVTGDAHNEASFLFVKPRVLISWTPFGEDQARLRVERTISQLDFQDFSTVSTLDTLVVTAGNPKLEPERDWIAEGALEHHFWRAGVATLTLSHAWLDKVIDDFPFDGFSSPGNIGRGRRETATLDFTAPMERFGMVGGELKAQGVWKYSRVTDPTTGARRQVSLDQPFTGSGSLSNEVPRWKSSWRIDVTGGARTPTFLIDEVQRARTESQVSFLWTYKPRSDLVFQAQVQNLGDGERFRMRQIFDGLRSTGRLDQIERLEIRNRARFMFNVRKGL